MSICSNPQQRRINVAVANNANVILVLRNYTVDEYTAYLESRFKVRNKGKIEDSSSAARIKFIDELLIDIEAEVDGQREVVTYVDPADGEEKHLTRSVENWKDYVSPPWKIAAALLLEKIGAEIEDHLVKN